MKIITPWKCMRASAMALLLIGAATTARAYSDQVATNCADDYFAYCKQHAPESPEVRYCMEAHRIELSQRCVQALIDAGEVPAKYLIKKVGDRE